MFICVLLETQAERWSGV